MALTGNWLIVQRFLTTALYKLLRLAFVIVQSIFWQLNGTARKIREARLPHNYERSAQVLDVLLVHKFCRGQLTTVDNFLCTHNRFEHPQDIIDNDNITLMTINEHDAVFCEPSKKGNEHIERLTFMLQLGGVFYPPPSRTFYPVALKLLRVVTKAFVTFPEYMGAKNAEKKFRYLH